MKPEIVSLENIEKFRGAGGKPFTKPVVVLTGSRTFSAAEDFLASFLSLKRGKFVGENLSFMPLLTGLSFNFGETNKSNC